MIDLKLVQKQPEVLAKALADRQSPLKVDEFLELDGRRRALLAEVESLKQQQNAASRQVAQIKREGGDASHMMEELGALSARIKALDVQTAEAKAAHGTVTRHYRRWQKGEKTSTNPIASIFAWTGGLKHRADLDNTPEVKHFAETLEKVIISTVEGGQMTKDLAMLIGPDEPWLDTDGFMNALDENLAKALAE